MAIAVWGRVGLISLSKCFIKLKMDPILMQTEDLDYFYH